MMSRSKDPENVSPQTRPRVPVCKGPHKQGRGNDATIMYNANGTL